MDVIQRHKTLRIKQFQLAGCALLLLLNIAVGITVICCVVSIKQTMMATHTNRLMQEINTIYDEQLRKITNDGNDSKKKRGRQPDMSPAFLNLLKPVAYFTGLDFDRHIENQNDTAIRNWEPFVGPGGRQLMYNGMRYEQGSVIIPAPGVYAVYSHVKFYTEKNRQGDAEIDFHHSVMRYNALTQTSMPALADTMSENKNDVIDGGSLEYSSNIHGLLQLNAGDQLLVKVSHLKPLEHDRDWHYFGVYMATICECGLEQLSHTAYSPDLAPSDYFLFRNLKSALLGRHFRDDEDVNAATEPWLGGQSEDFYNSGIEGFEEK